MKKVEYLVGAFLTEFDIITHELPEETITPRKSTKRKPRKSKTTINKTTRKTEHITKKRNKSQSDVIE